VLPTIDQTTMYGVITIEQEMPIKGFRGNLGIQVAKDGRVWICLEGKSLLRFTPVKPNTVKPIKRD